MNDDRVMLSFEDAVAMLPDGEFIHTFRPGRGFALGADWEREEIIQAIKTGSPELSGETATAMGHGLVIQNNGSYLFIETRPIG